jgi:bifunctional DNA-binding transcriptional regulator/antitoxin component of YhaV-PrlF toxin-antitoxin module
MESLSDIQYRSELKSKDRVVRKAVNKKGEIKLPAMMLRALGIRVGDEIIMRLEEGELVLRGVNPRPDRTSKR